jgi:pimeloyl-ACP methyl ester carboxylesterase
MSRPTIVFVHGAWHSTDIFNQVISILEHQGYNCVTVPMPSVGRVPSVKSLDDDIAAVRSAVLKELETGNDVIVNSHSKNFPTLIIPNPLLFVLVYLDTLSVVF